MIGNIFEALDGLARVIGWIGMIYGILWLVKEHLVSEREIKEGIADREAQMKFEAYLRENEPLKYNRYRDISDRMRSEGDDTHWHRFAQDAGVPNIEILKKR